MNLMLMRYAYVFTLPAIYCSTYVEETDGNACVVYIRYGIFLISARSIQKWEFAKNLYRNLEYSGMDYIFLVLFYDAA
jgi:hypothetical protein